MFDVRSSIDEAIASREAQIWRIICNCVILQKLHTIQIAMIDISGKQSVTNTYTTFEVEQLDFVSTKYRALVWELITCTN